MMRVCVVGAGHVGLVTAACLAELGHRVKCVDIDEAKIASIKQGTPPIYEAGLAELLGRTVGSRLTASVDLAEGMGGAEVIVIAVGTPLQNGEMDESALRAAAEGIGRMLGSLPWFPVVVVKSTVLPGLTDSLVVPLLEEASGRRAGRDFGVAVNPEFLTEGRAVVDFMDPDRIVLGVEDDPTLQALRRLYGPLAKTEVVVTNRRTAELIKYASNALLASLVSFSNQIADLAEAVGGIDAAVVMQAVHSSKYLTVRRGGEAPVTAPIVSFLEAGSGFGGSCLPKDVAALAAAGRRLGESTDLLEAVLTVNSRRPGRLISLLEGRLPHLAGTRVVVLGLAFKPDTADVRASPALLVIEGLLKKGAVVVAHDPVVGADAVPDLVAAGVEVRNDLEEALKGAEAVVVVTAWEQYRRLGALLTALDLSPIVVDGRRVVDPRTVPRYVGIGWAD